jgi:hypothetical protein
MWLVGHRVLFLTIKRMESDITNDPQLMAPDHGT